MGTFTTKLELGGAAFAVQGGLDPYVEKLTVGQIQVIQTHPKGRFYEGTPCYVEEYMCFETGVGGGTIWTYGKNIFATEAEAQVGVIAHQQAAYKQRAARDARMAEAAAEKRERDLQTLRLLKEQYEVTPVTNQRNET